MGAAAMGSDARTVGGGRCIQSVRIWSCNERLRGQHGGGSHGERHTDCRGREVRSFSKNLELQGEMARRAAWGRQPWGAAHGLWGGDLYNKNLQSKAWLQ